MNVQNFLDYFHWKDVIADHNINETSDSNRKNTDTAKISVNDCRNDDFKEYYWDIRQP